MIWKLTAPLRVVYKIWFAIWFMLVGIIMYPLYRPVIRNQKYYPYLFALKRYIYVPLLMIGWFIWLNKKQAGKIPAHPMVICPNHASYLDIVLMYLMIPGIFIFMGKQELKKFPFVGLFFKYGLHVTVNRNSKADGSRALDMMREKIAQGYSVVIFPEGTTTKNPPYMNPFKIGGFKLAVEKQIPILPVTFIDTWQVLSKPEKLFGHARPGRVRVVIHPAVETKGLNENDLLSLQNKVREIITQPLIQVYPFLKNNNYGN